VVEESEPPPGSGLIAVPDTLVRVPGLATDTVLVIVQVKVIWAEKSAESVMTRVTG
jgi:hypothetical protein